MILFKRHPRVEPDSKDKEIAEKKLNEWSKRIGPRVGDYIIMPDGEYQRFAYDWKDRGLQTCINDNFYLGHGYAEMSGGLNPLVKRENIISTGENKSGGFWFFHHNHATAFNGVGLHADCRVYKHI